MKETYANSERFVRRYLYIHKENSRQMDIEAAKQNTDVSQILNAALAVYFARKKK